MLLFQEPPKFIKMRKPVENASEKLINDFGNINLLEQLETSTDPENSYQIIADSVTVTYNACYPTVEKRFKRHRHTIQAWMTLDILAKIALKDKLYVKYRKATDHVTREALKTELNDAQNEINTLIREAKTKYYAEKISKFKNDIKKNLGYYQ